MEQWQHKKSPAQKIIMYKKQLKRQDRKKERVNVELLNKIKLREMEK